MGLKAEESEDKKSNRSRQKNKRGDSKVESNDSPEIQDRGETSDIPGLSSGVDKEIGQPVRRRVTESTVSDNAENGAEPPTMVFQLVVIENDGFCFFFFFLLWTPRLEFTS